MSLLSEHKSPPAEKRRWPYALIVLVLVAGAGYFLFSGPGPAPEPIEPAAPVPAPTPAAAEPEPPAAEPVEVAKAPTPAPAPRPEPEPPPPPAPPQFVLRVTSDVEGADVFVDRQFVGTTPFESDEITAGRHRLNVSADGYESHAEDVEITDDLTAVAVMFRQVRLDQRVDVVHKHRFGECQGALVASTDGIHYQTDDDDGFRISLDALDEFAVDYLEHNLRITVRDGRTYNFTDSQENADALFVFHREVEKARERLARGDRPAS